LRISPEKGLEIIAPLGFDQRQVSGLLLTHKKWIENTLEKIRAANKLRVSGHTGPPETIELVAIDESWRVEYQSSDSSLVTISERPGNRLLVRGPIQDIYLVHAGLRNWLMKKAKTWLSRWALDVADELGLPCRQVTVRNQRTRLGSCTSSRHLSLNAKLLFFPESAVRYVLVHELCHILHLNHSPAFWKEVEKREPNYRKVRLLARAAWRKLPDWTHNPR
jgi:hypothetical protein